MKDLVISCVHELNLSTNQSADFVDRIRNIRQMCLHVYVVWVGGEWRGIDRHYSVIEREVFQAVTAKKINVEERDTEKTFKKR